MISESRRPQTPDAAASPRRLNLAFLVAEIRGWYRNAFHAGVVDAAADAGVNLCYFLGGHPVESASPGSPGSESQGIYAMVQPSSGKGLFDGLILGGSLGHGVSPETMSQFCQAFDPLPRVAWALDLPDTPSMLPDSYGGIYEVVSHLIEVHGYRRLAFIRGPDGQVEAESRYRAYCDCLLQHGLELDPGLFASGDFSVASGKEAIHSLLEVIPRPQAVVSANDLMALGALDGILEMGLRVPKDIALTGFDDLIGARLAAVPLTTVRQAFYEGGRQAVMILIDRIHGGTLPGKVDIKTSPVIRRSCGCTEDAARHAVVNADEFILPKPRRQEAIDFLLAALHPYSVTDFDLYVHLPMLAIVEKLWDALQESEAQFISTLQGILKQAHLVGGDISAWNDLLSAFRQLAQRGQEDLEEILSVENLFQQVRLILGEEALLSQASQRVDVERQESICHQMGSALTAVGRLEDLSPAVEPFLRRLEIPRCYAILYCKNDQEDSPAESRGRLVLLSPPGQHLPSTIYDPFSVSQVLPAGILKDSGVQSGDRRSTFIILPLIQAGLPLGYIVFEYGPRGWELYTQLAEMLSGAVFRCRLIGQREQALNRVEVLLADSRQMAQQLTQANNEITRFNQQLERMVSDRTEELGRVYQAREELYIQTQQRLQRITALRTIDTTITASLDLRVTLDVMLEQTRNQLEADGARVLLYDPVGYTLVTAAENGLHSHSRTQRLRIGEGLSGRVALDRRMLIVSDLRTTNIDRTLPEVQNLIDQGFTSYIAVPLITKGQLHGVLEICHRDQNEPDREWLDFLETLAGQAAIAIENSQLFNHLQRTNSELALAYDSTLAGWARALELRDQETEGHSQRVTDLTLRLASPFNISGSDLTHIRRGALLHDIGKMAIPDNILFKTEPLNPDEWEIMRKHPQLAYDLIYPISYLRPAAVIPYSHHEKWDGTGYPRGVSGEHIPLPARIFAVVDVWDALRSDRSYRSAWSDKQALEYIRSQSGQHFDPRVVNAFLEIIH